MSDLPARGGDRVRLPHLQIDVSVWREGLLDQNVSRLAPLAKDHFGDATFRTNRPGNASVVKRHGVQVFVI